MIEFFIPSTPVAQGRPRFSSRGGFARAYDPKKSRDYKAYVRACAEETMAILNREPYPRDIPLCVRMEIGIARPTSKPKRYKLPTTKPDADNYYKGVSDSLNGICFHDDSQITHVTITKRYSNDPGVRVVIWEDEL